MIGDTYIFRDSCVHRASPGRKILSLIALCTFVALTTSWPTLAGTSVGVALLYRIAGITISEALNPIRSMLWIFLAVFATHAILNGVDVASLTVTRLILLITAASLVTMTTKTSEFVDGLLVGLRWAPPWVPADQIALALSLALRLIPLTRLTLDEVRVAQRARQMDGNIKALIVPLIVRSLKRGDELAEAIRARSHDPCGERQKQ